MTSKPHLSSVALATSTVFGLASAHAAEAGFINDTTATLQVRNYHFSRDGPNQQSKAQEWAQGFILNVKSGYTEGTVGFGMDVLGQFGFKLDSSSSRVNTGCFRPAVMARRQMTSAASTRRSRPGCRRPSSRSAS